MGRDAIAHFGHAGLHVLHQPRGLVLASGKPDLGAGSTDTRLDRVDRSNARDHLMGERRLRFLVNGNELAPCMREAEGELDRAGRPLVGSQRLVNLIAVDLQNAGKVDQLGCDLVLAAAWRENVGHGWRRRSAPGTVIDRVRPKLADFGAASPGIEHRHRRLVAKDQWRGVDGLQLKIVQPLQPPCRPPHPAGQCGPIEANAVTGQDLRLTIQG